MRYTVGTDSFDTQISSILLQEQRDERIYPNDYSLPIISYYEQKTAKMNHGNHAVVCAMLPLHLYLDGTFSITWTACEAIMYLVSLSKAEGVLEYRCIYPFEFEFEITAHWCQTSGSICFIYTFHKILLKYHFSSIKSPF